MPSRKKVKGKARKSAKEAKAKEEESRAVGVANQRQGESVGELMQRLIFNAVSQKPCTHGCPSLPAGEKKICQEFIDTFTATFLSLCGDKVVKAFRAATDTTEEEYEEIYDSKLDTVVSIFLYNGAKHILHGDSSEAQLYASFACYFEEYIASEVRKTEVAINWVKPFELLKADDHTLVSYFKKRISCSCLDEKYKEVKSVKKMGWCCNPSCSLPERRVERSKMFSCTQCGVVNYCSVACQKNHWREHKEFCAETAEMKAAFKSSQSQI